MLSSMNNMFSSVDDASRQGTTLGRLAVFLVLFSLPIKYTSALDTLDSLKPAQQETALRLCTPVQFLQGQESYRDCLINQIELAMNGTDLQFAAMSDLPIAEQYAVQRACSDAGALHSPQYLRCADKQLLELETLPPPDFSALPQHEQRAITRQCSTPAGGVGEYRTCANSAIASLSNFPEYSFEGQSISERHNIKLECSLTNSHAAGYRQCLLDALDIPVSLAFNKTRTAVDSEPVPGLVKNASSDTSNDLAVTNSDDKGWFADDMANTDSPLNSPSAYTINAAIEPLEINSRSSNKGLENNHLVGEGKQTTAPAAGVNAFNAFLETYTNTPSNQAPGNAITVDNIEPAQA